MFHQTTELPPADNDDTSDEEFHSPVYHSEGDDESDNDEHEQASCPRLLNQPQGIWDLDEDEGEDEAVVPSSTLQASCGQTQVADDNVKTEQESPQTEQPDLVEESEDDLTPQVRGVRNHACTTVLVSESEESLPASLGSAQKGFFLLEISSVVAVVIVILLC